MKATNTRIEVEISQEELREFVKEKTGVDVSEMDIDGFYWSCENTDNIKFEFTK